MATVVGRSVTCVYISASQLDRRMVPVRPLPPHDGRGDGTSALENGHAKQHAKKQKKDVQLMHFVSDATKIPPNMIFVILRENDKKF